MKELRSKYKERGLVIVGVHTPEFPYERGLENVERALLAAGLEYPVALDSANTTWKLYGNHYWPRQTLICAYGFKSLPRPMHFEEAYARFVALYVR